MRLFVGIFLPDHIINHIVTIQQNAQQLEIKARYVEPENLHITLAFIGDTPTPAEDIISRLSMIQFPAFNAYLQELELIKHGPHRALLWISVASHELVELSRRIKTVLELPPEKHTKEISHITLARIRRIKDPEKVLSFAESTTINQTPFRVDSFDLVASHLGTNGPRYLRLRQFLLRK